MFRIHTHAWQRHTANLEPLHHASLWYNVDIVVVNYVAVNCNYDRHMFISEHIIAVHYAGFYSTSSV
jgi:hypothetical protein